MKRTIALLLSLVMLLSLAACGTKTDDPQTPDETPTQGQESGEAQPSGASDTSDAPTEPEHTRPAEQESEDSTEQTPAETPVEQPEAPAKPETPAEKPAERPSEEKPAASQPEDAKKPDAQPSETPTEEKPAASSSGALSILTTVWNTYGEDEVFPSAGGDAEHAVDGTPGSFDWSNADSLSYMLTFPAEDASLIDDAASLMHMMNMNTFTCGTFHVVSASDVTKLADDLHTTIQGKHWMCGFPDKLVIVTLDQYLVSLYGNEDLVNTFRDKLTASYSAASVVYDEAIG